MKILICHDGSPAHFFDRTGIAKSLQYSGYNVTWWDYKNKPVFDIFAEQGPFDIFYGQTYNLDRPTIKCIENNPAMRVVLRAGEWGNHTDNWTNETKQKYPILIESKKVREEILKLKDNTNKPDFIHIHYHEDYLDNTHSNWIKNGINVISIKNASDLFDYTNGRWREEFSSDICFIGGAWAYKYKTLEKYIVPLCNPQLNLKVKIFGNGWNVPQFCGSAPQEIVKDLLKSAAICPNVSELHSQDFGYDVIERPFKLASNKCFIISDYVEGLEKIYGDSIVYAKTTQDFIEKVYHYLKNPQEKMAKIAKAYEITLREHTYFDRAASILDNLNMKYEANNLRIAKMKFIQENGL
jgi:hypothetical protein